MSRDRLLIFDADGTLLNTMRFHADLAADCIHNHFGTDRGQARADYIRTAELPFHTQLDALFPGVGYASQRAACAFEYNTRKVEEVYARAKVFPDIEPCMERLASSNVVDSVVSTNTVTNLIQPVLVAGGVSGYFSGIVGPDYGSRFQHINHARRPLHRNVFLVSDSPGDMGLHKYDVITVGRAGIPEDGMHMAESLLRSGATCVMDNFRGLPGIVLGRED
jgi:phosphoglycolate phosphatase-like HAD superfamily hydrolase